jgi:hypothetical protein
MLIHKYQYSLFLTLIVSIQFWICGLIGCSTVLQSIIGIINKNILFLNYNVFS